MPVTPPDPGKLRLIFNALDFALRQLEDIAAEYEDNDLAASAREVRAIFDRLEARLG